MMLSMLSSHDVRVLLYIFLELDMVESNSKCLRLSARSAPKGAPAVSRPEGLTIRPGIALSHTGE